MPEDTEALLDGINAALHDLGPEPYANINRLTRLCGELLGADASVYYRLEKGSLFAVGRWGLSADFNAVVAASSADFKEDLRPEGLYVRQGVGHGGKPPCDVSCARLGMKACAGRLVLANGAAIGLQCVLYRAAYVPRPLHARLMILVTGFLAVEEERLRVERARLKLSEELRQSQKMEAIGLLPGGVAHDFNNALTSIRGNAEMILSGQDLSEAVRDEAHEIVKASEYAGTLTRQLLTFSRKQIIDPQFLDLNDIVTNLIKILRRTLGEHIAIELALA
ncbi:MAG: histidine kinase dimerization/phospho-acceptor domain-containing protein, partial [Elusimicrobiota bacterium]